MDKKDIMDNYWCELFKGIVKLFPWKFWPQTANLL